MQVDEAAEYLCGICKQTVDPKQRARGSYARWYKYTHPSSGWTEWGQMCGACLSSEWRSMNRSWGETTTVWQDSCSHDEWKKRLFIKVICARLRSPPTTAGTDEEDSDEADYELMRTVATDEADDL